MQYRLVRWFARYSRTAHVVNDGPDGIAFSIIKKLLLSFGRLITIVEKMKGYFMVGGANSTNTWNIFLFGGQTQISCFKKLENKLKYFMFLKCFFLSKF